MKTLLALLFLLPVHSHAVELGLRVTKGNAGYSGLNLYGLVPVGDLSIRPMLETVESDLTNDETVNNGSVRVGYDTNLFSLGLTGGMTPDVDGYSNTSVGADLTFTISATGKERRQRRDTGGAPRGKGLARVDVGGGFGAIRHKDEKDNAGATRGTPRKLVQSDFNLFLGAEALGFRAQISRTESSYDKDITGSDRPAPRLAIEGLNTRLIGFPERSTTITGEAPFLPVINPFVRINATTFEGSSLKSKTLAVGAYIGLELLELFVAGERTNFNGAVKDLTTYSVGGALRFGLGE